VVVGGGGVGGWMGGIRKIYKRAFLEVEEEE
jgi:hypothetical protein